VKEWQFHSDQVLSTLAKSITNRKLFQTKINNKPFSKVWEEKMIQRISDEITHDKKVARYFLIIEEITNNALNRHSENIHILYKDGKVKDIRKASDINLSALTKTVRKYFACFPKELDIY